MSPITLNMEKPVMTHTTSDISAASTVSGRVTTTKAWQSEAADDGEEAQLFFVTSYSDFDRLAHGPTGTEAKQSLYVYRFHPSDGSLVLLNMQGDAGEVMNPAFSRYHPRLNVVYTCTEDCQSNGKIFAYKIKSDGRLEALGEAVDAGGTSTCYLTIDKAQKNMLAVNYWNSTLAVIPLDPETGAFQGPVRNMYDPKGGKGVVASAKKDGGVNHSCNDESTIRQRQADPHSHALVLDPFVGCVAYVPDLGKDLIREFYYDRQRGAIDIEMNVMPSGLCTGMPDGPRYFDFHPRYNIGYVVNELSSTIAVFEIDRGLLNEMSAAGKRGEDMNKYRGRSTLRLVQSIGTIPSAFPTKMNTCGRICVHKSGRFVAVSNRGHQSITVYKVKSKGPRRGELETVGYFHTRGSTPRHFQFDHSGQYLLVANQDSDSLAVFSFNLSTGEIKYTGNEYRVPSPNFICCCPTHQDDEYVEVTYNESVPLSSIVSQAMESGSGSDSEDSTIPNTAIAARKGKVSVEDQLAQAQHEIAELRKLLAEKL